MQHLIDNLFIAEDEKEQIKRKNGDEGVYPCGP